MYDFIKGEPTWSNKIEAKKGAKKGKSRGLAVEHLAHDQKVVGSIPDQC